MGICLGMKKTAVGLMPLRSFWWFRRVMGKGLGLEDAFLFEQGDDLVGDELDAVVCALNA